MAKQVDKTPFDLEYEEAKSRYDYPFKKAEAAGVPREEILEEVKANRPEKATYRIKRGVGLDPSRGWIGGAVSKGMNEIGASMARASREKQRENEGKDIWDTIAEAPGKAYKTTPGAIAVDSIGKAISRIAPSSDKSLLGKYTPPPLARGENRAKVGIKDVVGENVEGMTTPKGLATAAGFMVPGVNVAVGASVLPEMITGAWESGVKGARDFAKGDVRGGTKGIANAAIQGLMAKGLVKHGKAKKVAREVEANKVIEARANELSDNARASVKAKYQFAREDVLNEKVKARAQRDIAKAREDVLREKAENRVRQDMENAQRDVRENPFPESQKLPDKAFFIEPDVAETVKQAPKGLELKVQDKDGSSAGSGVTLENAREVVKNDPKIKEMINAITEFNQIKNKVAKLMRSKKYDKGRNKTWSKVEALRERGNELAQKYRITEAKMKEVREYHRYNKMVDEERLFDLAKRETPKVDVAETVKATFTEEAATNAMKPKRRSKAAQDAEKRAHLEEVARANGLAEAETAGMTTAQLIKTLVKKGVPRVGLQLETRSISEQAMQRAIERELAKRAGKKIARDAPMAAAAGVGKVVPQTTTAPSPLKSTADVADKVLSTKELAEQKDLAGVFGTSKIDRTRGLEELARNQSGDLGKIHKETQAKMYEAQKGFAHTQAAERKAMLKNLDKIGIKRSTKMMKLVQEYGEKVKPIEKITKEVGPKKAQQIVEADKMFRETYNRFINEINRVRKENGISAIEPRADYYRHVVEMGGDSIGGIADAMAIDPTLTYGHGGKSSILKKRTANMKHEVNALNGFLDYLPQYALETNLKPFSHYAKGALNDITKLVGGEESGALQNTRAFYEGIVRDAAREKSALDTSVEKAVSQIGGKGGLKAYIGMKKVGSNVIRNTVAKFSPIVTNFAAYMAAAGESGLIDATRGAARMIMELGKKEKSYDKSYFMPERFESRANRKANTKFFKRNSPLSGAFELTDKHLVSSPIWYTMFEKGKRLKVKDPYRYADAETGKIVGARSIMDRPEYYNSSIGRQLTPFTLEVNSLYRQIKGYLKGKRGGEKSAASAAWKLTKMTLAGHAINMMLEETTGNPVLPDPIQAVMDAAEKDDPVEAFGRIAAEAINIFPSGSLASQFIPDQYRKAVMGRDDSGRYGVVQAKPFKSAAKLAKGAYRAATGGEPVEGKMNAAIDLFGSVVPKLPGGQIKATGQGINVMMNDGDFMWGAIPIHVDLNDPWEKLRLLGLGPYATNAFKKVVEEQSK